MKRRHFLLVAASSTMVGLNGCRGYQYGHLIKKEDANLVGSHNAGAEVYDPLVEEAVLKLLARQAQVTGDTQFCADGSPMPKTIYFVGVENKSVEELRDFKDQIYQQIDSKILESQAFQPISSKVVQAALFETRLRPDSLLVPDNMQLFSSVLQRQGAAIDYLLYATLTSGTTERNASTQRDYLLTLELINVHNGTHDVQSAEIRKGYHKSVMGKWWNYNPFKP